MALRIKLRPWKNKIKIHINAKELSFLGVCGGRERDRGERNDKGRERVYQSMHRDYNVIHVQCRLHVCQESISKGGGE